MVRRRALASLLTVAATGGLVVLGGAAPGAADGAADVTRTPTAQRKTVTLVTGDQVTVGGPAGLRVQPAEGREHLTFTYRGDEEGDLHVVPQDAAPLLAAGRLDPRLLNVSALVRDGYGDRPDLPLIVDYPAATPRIAGTKAVRELPAMSAVAVRAKKDTVFWATASRSAKRIWLDGRVRATLDHSVPQIGAPTAWESGHTGAGTTVAVLDTGIDVTHPDLADAVTAAQDFSGTGSTNDGNGHGTHVASTITGSGARFTGVAPDAALLNGKVLDDSGWGWDSDIAAGMTWAATSGADVINMSLGSPGQNDGTDFLSQTVNQLTAETGALFVISAGNDGPGAQTIGAPGAADAALTVGAVDRDDQLAEFSSRGPRFGDGAVKPDLTAPGVDIVAAKAANGWIGEPAEDGYVALSGTSMAAPHVAGAAAILAGQHPDWTADRLKATLMATAVPHQDLSVTEQGTGRVDVAAAIGSTVSASPASVAVGRVAWPYDKPIDRTVAYVNDGTAPVTLDLAFDGDADVFGLSADQVTVPAGGRAEVTVSVDTAEATAGSYATTLVATGGGQSVRTPVGVALEGETYDVTVRAIDHNGAPAENFFIEIIDVETGAMYWSTDPSGTDTDRLPKGEYLVRGAVYSPTEPGETIPMTQFTEPAFVVDGDEELVLDARDGNQPGFRLDAADAHEAVAYLDFRQELVPGQTLWGIHRPDFDRLYLAPSTTSAGERFGMRVEAQLARPDGSGEFRNSPYLYHLRWDTTGGVPSTMDRRIPNRDLAKVRSTHALQQPNTLGDRNGIVQAKLPFTLTEWYTPNVPWFDSFAELSATGEYLRMPTDVSDGRVYRKGKVTEERWNSGVFGPAFPADDRLTDWYAGTRSGDELGLTVPLYTDSNPAHLSPEYGDVTTTLLRDGEVFSELPGGGYLYFVPPEPATYTLRMTSTRDARLSTQVGGEWTFRSGFTDQPTPVDLMAVRFAPDLDNHNRALAGEKFRIPVFVQRNNASSPARLETPKVEVSYDDGRTWQRAKVSGDPWVAQVNHPRSAKFVSLRASVSDSDGNVAKHTVIRAYALK